MPEALHLHERGAVLRAGSTPRESMSSCPVCDKSFASSSNPKASLQQHREATGHFFTYRCAVCQKDFNSEHAVEQHVASTGHVELPDVCPTCDKTFTNPTSLQQHMESTGHRQGKKGTKAGSSYNLWSNDYTRVLDPPFPNASGKWVRRANFTGQKSFGVFTCGDCDKDWLSAHAQVSYTQQCKACKCKAYPSQMWENDGKAKSDTDSDDEREGQETPHLSHLCGACKAGVCKVFQRLGRRVH